MKKVIGAVVAAGLLGAACGGGAESEAHHSGDHASADHQSASAADEAKPNIVETAQAAGNFTTLVAAVQAAGLVDTLSGDGPFTVFAPTDEAFAKLPEGTLEELLKPENKGKLTAILTYHVVPGDVRAEQVVSLDSATTVQGSDVKVSTRGEGVQINESNVTATDIACSNGVIHVVDAVLLPPEAS